MNRFWNVKSPITVHVEVTDACDERCRHCYNFFRDGNKKCTFITREQIGFLIDEFKKNEVMHVIVTGGEPLLAFEKTLHLIKKTRENNMTVSLNSNLMSATVDKMKKLKEAGLEHVLTTLHSHKSGTHDYISDTPGSFKKIINGIKNTQKAGVRVTVNTILFQTNKDDIYEIGKLLKKIGVKKFLANRVIPSPTNSETYKKQFYVGKDEIKKMFSDLRRIRDEIGLDVGTCRAVPLCVFDSIRGNLEFMDRHCVAGRRHMLIDVRGDTAACVHELRRYGNVYEIGLKACWGNMRAWRGPDFVPQECQRCHMFHMCDAGCRMVAESYCGRLDGYDILRRGAEHLPDFYEEATKECRHLLDKKIRPNPGLDYRKEEGFFIFRNPSTKSHGNLTFGGANITFIDEPFGKAILMAKEKKTPLSEDDLNLENKNKILFYILKGLLVAKD